MRVQFIHVIYSEIRALLKNKFRGFGPDMTLSVSYGPNPGLELIPTVIEKVEVSLFFLTKSNQSSEFDTEILECLSTKTYDKNFIAFMKS